jgi:hypothetical protein
MVKNMADDDSDEDSESCWGQWNSDLQPSGNTPMTKRRAFYDFCPESKLFLFVLSITPMITLLFTSQESVTGRTI